MALTEKLRNIVYTEESGVRFSLGPVLLNKFKKILLSHINMLKHNFRTIGIAIGSFIAGSQILHLIDKIKNSQNFLTQAIIFAIGIIIVIISLYSTYPYKNK